MDRGGGRAHLQLPQDFTVRGRERHFHGLVSDLVPRERRLHPTMSDDQVLEMAERMAELRPLGEEVY